MALFLFWGSVALILYAYVFFPILVVIRGLVWRKPYRSQDTDPLPFVSIIIAAYNEEKEIGGKLDNILLLDYPKDRLEVLIASDGSTDRTNAIVQSYEDRGIKLLALPRLGKAGALNAAVSASQGEILVFSDANSMYRSDALRQLVRPFADATVGGVAGNQCYLKKKEASSVGAGERSYWDFDRILKQFESSAGNTISATGAIYAIRRSLFQPVMEGVTDDFYTSTAVIEQGFRLVFSPEAIAYESVAGTSSTEFGRKVRVITRGLRGVFIARRRLMNPFRYGFYALQLFSHKALRRIIVYPLILLFVVNPFLWQAGFFYQLAMIGQLVFYSLGLLGWILDGSRRGRKKIFTMPYFFCLVNLAVLVATINIMRGQQIKRWEPQRKVEPSETDPRTV
jgi:cellulose synthase/poly-beta-1,6-N-acetylglucosamine synthase-like glycosyltransferase